MGRDFHRLIRGTGIYNNDFIYKFRHAVQAARNMHFFIFDNHTKTDGWHVGSFLFDLLSAKFFYTQVHIDFRSACGRVPCKEQRGRMGELDYKIS